MKTASAGMQTHLNQSVTTLTSCWRITRTDGTAFHFTEHDKALTVDLGDGKGPKSYKATSSYNRSAIKTDDGFSVDNLDLLGVFSDADIKETELRAGLFDYAAVEIFVVNWNTVSDGVVKMRRGRLGEVVLLQNGAFHAELRGLTQAFSRRIGEVYTAECRADLGDARCKVPIYPDVVARETAYAVGDFVRASSTLDFLTFLLSANDTYDDPDDKSVIGASLTYGANAVIQSTWKKFGAGAIEFSPVAVDPTAAYVSAPDNAGYELADQPFTIDCWVRFKDLTATEQIIASKWETSGDERGWKFSRNGGNLQFSYSTDGTVGTIVDITGAFSWAVDTNYHVAVTRDSSDDIRLFVNGTQVGVTTAAAVTIYDGTAMLRLGAIRDSGGDDLPLYGYLDEVRILLGSAAWTAGFSVPTSAYSGPADLLSPDFDDVIYQCTTAGTTAASQPTYDTTVSNTTTDGTAVFTAEEAWSRACTVTAVDGTEPRKKFTVTELTPNTGGPRGGFADDFMNNGAVVFETGNNAGVSMEIRDFTADDGVTIEQVIELYLDLPFDIVVGDTLRAYPGCDKRLTTCVNKFDNIVNMRAEPYVPGEDSILKYPDAKA